jgi:hypothetical protein
MWPGTLPDVRGPFKPRLSESGFITPQIAQQVVFVEKRRYNRWLLAILMSICPLV